MNDMRDKEAETMPVEQSMPTTTNGIGILETGITALEGLTIEAVTTMPAEVKRESGHYVLLRCKDTDGYVRRIILAYMRAELIFHGFLILCWLSLRYILIFRSLM